VGGMRGVLKTQRDFPKSGHRKDCLVKERGHAGGRVNLQVDVSKWGRLEGEW